MSDVKITVEAATAEAKQSIDQLDKSIDTLGKTADPGAKTKVDSLVSSVALGQAAYNLGRRAVDDFTGAIKSSIDAGKEAEEKEKALKDALFSTGREVDSNSKHFFDYSQQMMANTTYSDEAVKSAQALLIQLTNLNNDGLDFATRGALGLATVMGGGEGSLDKAARMVAQAMEGNYISLTRWIPQLRQGKDEADKKRIVMDFLSAAYKRATGEVDTVAGSEKQLKNQLDEAKETLGKAITQSDAYTGALSLLKKALDALVPKEGEASDATAAITKSYWESFPVIGQIVGAFNNEGESVRLANQAKKEMRDITEPFIPVLQKEADMLKGYAPILAAMTNGLVDLNPFVAAFAHETYGAAAPVRDLSALAKEFGITLKTELEQKLRDANDALAEMKKAGEQTPGAINKLNKSIKDLKDQLNGIAQPVRTLDDILKDLGLKSFVQVDKEARQARQDFDTLTKSFKNGRISADTYAKGAHDVADRLKTATEEIKTTDAGVNKLGLDLYNCIPVTKVDADLGTMQTDWIAYFLRLHKYRELNYTEEQQRAINILDITKKTVEDMTKLYGDFGRDTLVAFEKWGGGTQGILTGIGDAFGNLAKSAIKMVEDILASMLEADAKAFLTTQRGAIANVIKSVMAWPFPLNLLAVGGAIAAVELLFSKIKHFDEGGIVPSQMLGMLHPHEAVIPLKKLPEMVQQITHNSNNYYSGREGKQAIQSVVIPIYLGGQKVDEYILKTTQKGFELRKLMVPGGAIG